MWHGVRLLYVTTTDTWHELSGQSSSGVPGGGQWVTVNVETAVADSLPEAVTVNV